MQEDSSNEDIVQSGEVALVLLYGGSEDERLDALRYKRFREKVASSTKYVEARSLPPTSAAAKFHSLTTKSRSGEDMRPTWTLNSGDGRTVLVSYCPSKPTCHLPQWSSSGCSDATTRQVVTQAGAHVETMD